MTPRPHRLAEQDLAALARGGGGAKVMRRLVAARRSRTLLLIRFVVCAAGADDIVARRAYQVLAQVRRVAPAAVDRVLDHPSVGAWVTQAALRLAEGGPAASDTLACVALAAAVRGRVTTTLSMPAREEISLPSLGIASRPVAGELMVRCGPQGTDLGHGVRIPPAWREDGPGWRAVPRIAVDSGGRRACFLLDRWAPGEPTSDMSVSDDPDLSSWRDRIAESWDLLARHHQQVADELVAAVTVLTPLRPPEAGISSATVADAFGCVFLSLGPDAESVAVALAHELRHTKLIALLDLFPLLKPVPGERFYVPWRNDPRPLLGLLHGTYAYAGVTAFWRRQRAYESSAVSELHAHSEFARWRVCTLEAARTMLGTDRLTPIGRRFVTIMADLLEQWCAEPVPDHAVAVATHLANEHRAQWLAAYRPTDTCP